MSLSPSSSVIIDLLLLADAALAGDNAEVQRLARRVEKLAQGSGACVIAKQARIVELLATKDTPPAGLAEAIDRLLTESEREIHAFGAWEDHDAAGSGRRSA
ncbi:MAG TPA: hypothetical protein VM621_14305 [Luteibacter sp.]|uniref:hypothetical protein n=1 Tax=Luteibacter sp. TaxID=1886636 RepID=UPI002C96BC58|nr:hypothetical protein [Luteibacter sp.]HVI56211.1 hypothetical protein [Luteibacter sp.]